MNRFQIDLKSALIGFALSAIIFFGIAANSAVSSSIQNEVGTYQLIVSERNQYKINTKTGEAYVHRAIPTSDRKKLIQTWVSM